MYIVIYEKYQKGNGVYTERPLAMFKSINEANVFIGMLAPTGRELYAKAI